MDDGVKRTLSKFLKNEEVERVEAFLNREFPLNGQAAIASVVISAKENGRSVTEVLAQCEKEWTENWNFQYHNTRGDTLAPGSIGKRNLTSIKIICIKLGIPAPQLKVRKAEPAKIPKGEFVVMTNDSTYRFGKYQRGGIRLVSSHVPLLRNQCMITNLVVGAPMEFEYYPVDPDGRNHVTSSAVVSIKPVPS